MLTKPYTHVSEEEYLRLEADALIRHEYVDGVMYAMTGGTLRHNIITGNVFSLLRAHLRGTPCRVFVNDAKVRIAKQNVYYYPDVMVSCESKLQSLGLMESVVEGPVLVVEVISPSTEGIDRREKLLAYRTLMSLREYVLVAPDQPLIEIHRRVSEVNWDIVTLSPGDPVELKSVDLATTFLQIYEETGVTLEAPQR
jgi:Uma2 family endonuclease